MVEVDSSNVLKVVLQFLQENHFNATAETLIKESNVRMNAVTDLHHFKELVRNGKWEDFLKSISFYIFEPAATADVLEQIVKELCSKGQNEAAQVLIKNSEPLIFLKQNEPNRFLNLEEMCYGVSETSTEKLEELIARRNFVAQELMLPQVEKGRLLSLIGQAMKSQFDRFVNAESYDSFLDSVAYFATPGKAVIRESPGERPIDVSEYGNITCIAYAKEMDAIILGAQDGFITLIDASTCELKKDLPYQQTESTNMMIMDSTVVGIHVSGKECLVAASSGEIIHWEMSSGSLIRRLTSIPEVLFVFFAGQSAIAATFGQLYILSLKSGAVLQTQRLQSVPSCGTVDDEGNLYLGFKDGSIISYKSSIIDTKKYQLDEGIHLPITSLSSIGKGGKVIASSGRLVKGVNFSIEAATVSTHISYVVSDGSYVYVLDDGAVCSVLDANTLTLISSFTIPEHLEGVVLTSHSLCILKNPNLYLYH
jgi:hypothetical protein